MLIPPEIRCLNNRTNLVKVDDLPHSPIRIVRFNNLILSFENGRLWINSSRNGCLIPIDIGESLMYFWPFSDIKTFISVPETYMYQTSFKRKLDKGLYVFGLTMDLRLLLFEINTVNYEASLVVDLRSQWEKSYDLFIACSDVLSTVSYTSMLVKYNDEIVTSLLNPHRISTIRFQLLPSSISVYVSQGLTTFPNISCLVSISVSELLYMNYRSLLLYTIDKDNNHNRITALKTTNRFVTVDGFGYLDYNKCDSWISITNRKYNINERCTNLNYVLFIQNSSSIFHRHLIIFIGESLIIIEPTTQSFRSLALHYNYAPKNIDEVLPGLYYGMSYKKGVPDFLLDVRHHNPKVVPILFPRHTHSIVCLNTRYRRYDKHPSSSNYPRLSPFNSLLVANDVAITHWNLKVVCLYKQKIRYSQNLIHGEYNQLMSNNILVDDSQVLDILLPEESHNPSLTGQNLGSIPINDHLVALYRTKSRGLMVETLTALYCLKYTENGGYEIIYQHAVDDKMYTCLQLVHDVAQGFIQRTPSTFLFIQWDGDRIEKHKIVIDSRAFNIALALTTPYLSCKRVPVNRRRTQPGRTVKGVIELCNLMQNSSHVPTATHDSNCRIFRHAFMFSHEYIDAIGSTNLYTLIHTRNGYCYLYNRYKYSIESTARISIHNPNRKICWLHSTLALFYSDVGSLYTTTIHSNNTMTIRKHTVPFPILAITCHFSQPGCVIKAGDGDFYLARFTEGLQLIKLPIPCEHVLLELTVHSSDDLYNMYTRYRGTVEYSCISVRPNNVCFHVLKGQHLTGMRQISPDLFMVAAKPLHPSISCLLYKNRPLQAALRDYSVNPRSLSANSLWYASTTEPSGLHTFKTYSNPEISGSGIMFFRFINNELQLQGYEKFSIPMASFISTGNNCAILTDASGYQHIYKYNPSATASARSRVIRFSMHIPPGLALALDLEQRIAVVLETPLKVHIYELKIEGNLVNVIGTKTIHLKRPSITVLYNRELKQIECGVLNHNNVLELQNIQKIGTAGVEPLPNDWTKLAHIAKVCSIIGTDLYCSLEGMSIYAVKSVSSG